jgi:radical SAM protein with 4Fe4S-binding SPASM domain
MMSHPSHYKRPLQRMSMDVLNRLADEIFFHVHSLSFTYGAEPLLHPEFPRFVEIAARYRIPEIYAVTNGMLLSEGITRALVGHGMHALGVSLDAANARTYEKIRMGGEWVRVMDNLEYLQRFKRDSGSRYPALELMFVMMKSNIAELPGFVDLAGDLGATSVNAFHLVPFHDLRMASESCSHVKETTNEMLRRARGRAEVLGIQFTAPPPFGEAAGPGPDEQARNRFGLPVSRATAKAGHCPFPWHFAAIDMSGDVVPCGWWNNRRGMGNIRSESFLSIWNNERYQKLRIAHRTGALESGCATCPAAGMGSVDEECSFAEI